VRGGRCEAGGEEPRALQELEVVAAGGVDGGARRRGWPALSLFDSRPAAAEGSL
jgi:hypothetical protein